MIGTFAIEGIIIGVSDVKTWNDKEYVEIFFKHGEGKYEKIGNLAAWGALKEIALQKAIGEHVIFTGALDINNKGYIRHILHQIIRVGKAEEQEEPPLPEVDDGGIDDGEVDEDTAF